MITFENIQEVDNVDLNNVVTLIRATLQNTKLIKLAKENSKIEEALTNLSQLLTGHRKPSLTIYLRLWLNVPEHQMLKPTLKIVGDTISASGKFNFETDNTNFHLEIIPDNDTAPILIAPLPGKIFMQWQEHFKLVFLMRPLV